MRPDQIDQYARWSVVGGQPDLAGRPAPQHDRPGAAQIRAWAVDIVDGLIDNHLALDPNLWEGIPTPTRCNSEIEAAVRTELRNIAQEVARRG